MWRWLAAGALGILFAALAAVAFVLGTDPGRQWLAARVSAALSSDAQTVRVEGIRLAQGLRVAVDRVAVSDPEGTWLEACDSEIHLALRPLLDGRIEIRALHIGQFHLARLPAGKEEVSSETSPLRMPDFAIDGVQLGQLQLAAAVFGLPVDVSELRGRVEGGGVDSMHIGIRAEAARVGVDTFLGTHVAVDFGLLFSADQWRLSGSLGGDGFTASGELEFSGEGTWPTGELRAEIDGASELAAALWPGLSSGRFTCSASALSRPDGLEEAKANLTVQDLRFDETAVAAATGKVELKKSRAEPGLAIHAETQVENASFQELVVTGANIRASGSWGNVDFSGTAGGEYAQPFALDAAGHLRWEGERWDVELTRASVRWAEIQARLTDPLAIRMQGDQTSIRGAAEMDAFELPATFGAGTELPRGRIAGHMQIDGTLASPAIEGSVTCSGMAGRTGKWSALPSADGAARFSLSGETLRVSAEIQTATNGTVRAEARVPARISLVPWELRLDPGGDFSADLRADLNLVLPDGSEALAAYGAVGGRVVADLQINGTPAEPRFEGSASCKGMATGAGAWAVLPPLDGSCRLSGSNGTVSGSAELQAFTNGAIRATAQVPVRMSLVPWKLDLDRAGELAVDLRANLDLALLNAADAFANSRIGGQIDLSVEHRGPVSGGTVTGLCVLADGEYENHLLGTVVREARLRMVSNGDSLAIESGSATDGGKGRLSLSGGIRLDPSEGLPYELEIGVRKMRVLRRPDAEATVSGTLAFAGTVSRASVEGGLQLDNAVVDLRNLRPPPPAELEPALATAPAAAVRPRDGSFALRLAVSIPGTLYVRGRSLDSAWAGDLSLEHAPRGTELRGHLESRRGTLLLLKRPFKLEEGRIDFDGRWPPEPSLRLEAVFNRSDLSARAQIVGTASDPDITLTSTPPLPEDEILARILFGEDLSGLTPVQAISLAAEASKLGQWGGGGGLWGDLQSAAGIDRVEIRENGQESAAAEVAVGKYLGDRSYVEMRRATATDSTERTRLYVEHELRPNIVLEAESGMEMRSGLGLFWKRDY